MAQRTGQTSACETAASQPARSRRPAALAKAPAILATLKQVVATTMQMLRNRVQRHAKRPGNLRCTHTRMPSQITRNLILGKTSHHSTLLPSGLASQRGARSEQTATLNPKLISARKLRVKLSKPRIDLTKHTTTSAASALSRHESTRSRTRQA